MIRCGRDRIWEIDEREDVGEFKDGKRNGQGTYTYSNGDMYEGEWKDGKYHGQGTYTFLSGSKFLGEFKDGERWNGTLYNKNGNIIYKLVNGKMV